MQRLTVPPATANPVEHADWLEIEALIATDRNSSMQDLASALRRAGSGEEVENERVIANPDDPVGDRGGETLEPIVEAAFAEVEDRTKACDGSYPFKIEDSAIQGHRGSRNALYVFLLLVSKFGKDAGPDDLNVAKLFEEVAEVAIKNCLGGPKNQIMTYQFGFPRRLEPSGFRAALDDLCQRLGEGVKSKERPTTKDQNDAALDLIAWRPFPDGRRGQIMAWGQCATGNDWREKLTELQPSAWASTWMYEMPTVLPLRTFFIPHRVRSDRWDVEVARAGVLFDRCRISALSSRLPSDVRDQCRAYSRHVLS
jgi:hypothetical protein